MINKKTNGEGPIKEFHKGMLMDVNWIETQDFQDVLKSLLQF